MARILVTGGAGFIGSHVCEALLARGDELVVLDDFDDFYDPALKRRNAGLLKPARIVEGDIRDRALLARLFAEGRFEAVIHLAARAGVRPSLLDPLLYEDVNVRGTLALLEELKTRPQTRFVFASSSSVYGANDKLPYCETDDIRQPVSPYAATKRAGELLLQAVAPTYGFRIASLRFFTVYGPRQRPDLAIHAFTRKMVEGETLTLFGDGTQARDYTYCTDIVAGVLAALAWTETAPVGVEHFNLGGNRSVPTMVMVETIAQALGIAPSIEWAPMQPGDVQQTAADLTKSSRVLGYLPRTPFPEGVRKFVSWYREAYGRAD